MIIRLAALVSIHLKGSVPAVALDFLIGLYFVCIFTSDYGYLTVKCT